LDDYSEQGDTVAGIYRKSLQYLVSRSFESRKGSVPLLGMEKYLKQLDESGVQNQMAHYVTAKELEFTVSASHCGLDNDANTLNPMLKVILGRDFGP
jgi:hypothetical protein